MDILFPYFCRIFLRKLIRQFSLMPTLQLHFPEKQTVKVLQLQQQLRQMEWELPSKKMFIHKVATFWALDGKLFYNETYLCYVIQGGWFTCPAIAAPDVRRAADPIPPTVPTAFLLHSVAISLFALVLL